MKTAIEKMTRVELQIHLAKEFCEFMNSTSWAHYEDGFHIEDLLDDLACMGICLIPDFNADATKAYFKLIKENLGLKSDAS